MILLRSLVKNRVASRKSQGYSLSLNPAAHRPAVRWHLKPGTHKFPRVFLDHDRPQRYFGKAVSGVSIHSCATTSSPYSCTASEPRCPTNVSDPFVQGSSGMCDDKRDRHSNLVRVRSPGAGLMWCVMVPRIS